MTTSNPKKPKKLSDFQAQTKNTNAHTPRGMGMLDHAIVDLGWIGAVTTAADGEIFAGSARHEVACDRFGDEAEPIVVESDGTRPIVVVRTDIPSASDPRAIKLGVADNRIARVNYMEDLEVLGEIINVQNVDLSDFYFDAELGDLFADAPNEDLELGYSRQNREIDPSELDSPGTFKFVFEYKKYLQLIARFDEYKSEHGITEDNEAFAKLLNA